ncbi:Phosphoheptose isomerase [bioreactor metagenome]|uniref:Phosphoheptose isomerase n=1 Tax=bioreactor metagenome TaxID=1076179 RepID=A0A645IWU5_9ZZZZ
MFLFRFEKKLEPEDLVIAIYGSENSKNVIKAVEYAKSIGTQVIWITGYNGGNLKSPADCRMYENIDDMQIAEDIHIMFDHMLLPEMSIQQ